MTRSSYELPRHPVRIEHLDCGSSEVYAIEWPPKVVVCTHCMGVLKLVHHDVSTQGLSYRRI